MFLDRLDQTRDEGLLLGLGGKRRHQLLGVLVPLEAQGHVSADESNALSESRGAAPDEVVLDPSGEIGRLYAAKTTPHMFIIDEEGVLRYDGAIDDRPSADPSTIEGAKNYVLAALGDMAAGRPVESPATKPYGCSVKYAH